MKKIKKAKFVYSLLLCVSLFLTACGKDGSSDNDTKSQNDAIFNNEVISGENSGFYITQGREWVYIPEVITLEDAHADYGRMQLVGDTVCYVSLGGEEENSARNICRYSLTDRKLTTVSINWTEGGNNWDMGYRFFTRDLGLYMTANVYPADYSSMKRFLCRLDSEGNCLFSKDITEQAGRNVSLRRLTADEQGRLYIFLDNGEILLYTGDGNYHGCVSYDSRESQIPAQVKGACSGADGKFYVCISKGSVNIAGGNTEETEGICSTLMEIDFENARLLEVAGNLPNINGLCEVAQQGGYFAGQDGNSAGQGSDSAGQDGNPIGGNDDSSSQYDLMLYDNKAVYGYRFDVHKNDSGTLGEELFLWMDSDINGYCVTNLYLLEDGRLCATVEDWMNDDRVLVMLKKTKAEQAPRREELVLATVNGGSDLATMAVKFNRGNSRYHLTVKNYEALTDLYNAVLTKKPIDLIDLSGINVQRLADLGLFEDLTPYVEQSKAFERSDFVDGILDVYTCGNTLVGIPAEFMIQTVVGNSAQLDNKTGLTLEELLSIEKRYPGAKAFAGVTKEEMMQYLMMFNEDAFIDWDAGVCNFDSENFEAILEYVSQFPDSLAGSPSAMAGGREEDPLSARIRNGEVLFAVAELYPPFILQDYVKMFGEDAACIGFPTQDGRGGHLLISSDAYAIAAVSEHKESAWSFIEEVLTQEKKGELYLEFWLTYPALKRVLNERMNAALEREELHREDIDILLALLPDAMPFYSVKEDEIIKIINEEAPAYYSGQKGIGDVAGIIQNRVQLYVNENIKKEY